MAEQNQLYLDLSHYYDQFCNHIDYAEQSDFAVRAHQCFATSGAHQYLDLACGTGQLLKLMEDKGFNVTGLDNSQEMLTQAATRCPEVSLLLNDLAGYDNKNEFDLITCFLYSLHYSQSLASLNEAINRAYNALKTGGVFMFDMVDKNGIANDAGVATHIENDSEKLTFQSRWWYSGEGDDLDLYLSITRDNAEGVHTWNDHHHMTAVDITSVKARMTEAGFDVFILDRDYARLCEWDGEGANVIVVGVKG